MFSAKLKANKIRATTNEIADNVFIKMTFLLSFHILLIHAKEIYINKNVQEDILKLYFTHDNFLLITGILYNM